MDSSKPRGTFGWYLYPSMSLPIRGIVLAWFAWGLAFTLFYGGLRALAAVKVAWAVPAVVSTLFAFLLFWMVTFPILIPLELAPIGVYVVQLVTLPQIWQGPGSSRQKMLTSLALLVGGYLVGLVLGWLGITVIGWIADLNPCVSWGAGVTGSVPPPASCQ